MRLDIEDTIGWTFAAFFVALFFAFLAFLAVHHTAIFFIGLVLAGIVAFVWVSAELHNRKQANRQ